MGFFSNLFTAEPVRLTIHDERDAYACILLACIAGDGISESESTALYLALKSKSMFAHLDIGDVVGRAVDYYQRIGTPSMLIDAAIGSISEGTKLPLFANCVDIILADGQVTKEEEEILDYLKGKFNVPDDLAQKAVEVLLVKNKG